MSGGKASLDVATLVTAQDDSQRPLFHLRRVARSFSSCSCVHLPALKQASWKEMHVMAMKLPSLTMPECS